MKPDPVDPLDAPPVGDVIEAALSRTKQCVLATELGWPESKVTGWKQRLQGEGSLFLSALNLKVVPADMGHYDDHSVNTLLEAFKIAARDMTTKALKQRES